jgi:hypothetical protein
MINDEPFEGYQRFHERCLALTGDAWCPYPSEEFARAIAKADDQTAIKLINQRRQYTFANFLCNEPMAKEIAEIL